MTTLTTTLALIKKHDPCEDGLKILLDYLGKDYPEDKEINLLTILESNGIDHFFWAFRAAKQDGDMARRLALQLSIAFAERVLHIYEAKYPDNNRPRKAIDSAKNYINKNTAEEIEEAAAAVLIARAEAWDAESEAAWAAWAATGMGPAAREEWDAAWAASAAASWAAVTGAAAEDAARMAAAWAQRAAGKEEQHAQILIIKSLLAD